jgi:hypothetical protein
MKASSQFVLRAAARLQTPILALFTLSLLATWPAGAGLGFVAGIAFALILWLHALVFGASAARRAVPPFLARASAVLGFAITIIGAALPRVPYDARVIEGGLFFLTVGTASLILSVLIGRAPTLREEGW